MAFVFEQGDIEDAPQEIQAVLAYWNGLCGDRPAPPFKEFDLLEIPPHLLPHTLVVDYLADGDLFKFRYFGSLVADRHGQEMTGKTPTDFKWSPFGDVLEREYRAYLERGQPEFLSFGFTNENGVNELHKVLRLPLSEDGQTISGLVAILMASSDREESQKFFEGTEFVID